MTATTTLIGPTDDDIMTALIATLTAGLAALGVAGVAVKQAGQPTQQGAPSGPVLLLHKILDHRCGWQSRSDHWDAAAGAMVHEEKTWHAATYQVDALFPQSPAGPMTPGDLLDMAAGILQGRDGLRQLRAAGLGVLAVRESPQAMITDERRRFEQAPQFHIGLTYRRIRRATTPLLAGTGVRIEAV